MKYSEAIKPISYLKANAAKVLREVRDSHNPMIITQNGEAKAVIQDIKAYEETQESLAMLKILALEEKSLIVRKGSPAAEVFAEIDELIANDEK